MWHSSLGTRAQPSSVFASRRLAAWYCCWPTGSDHSIWTYFVPVMIFLTGFGMVSPLVTATALQPFGDRAGLASALLGFLQMAGAAIGVVLTASIASPTLAIGIVQAALTMLGLILYVAGLARGSRAPGSSLAGRAPALGNGIIGQAPESAPDPEQSDALSPGSSTPPQYGQLLSFAADGTPSVASITSWAKKLTTRRRGITRYAGMLIPLHQRLHHASEIMPVRSGEHSNFSGLSH